MTDGPVRTQTNDVANNQNVDMRELDRLRLEVDSVRRELAQERMRADRLESQLQGVQANTSEYTQNLEQNLVQSENNLERSKVS